MDRTRRRRVNLRRASSRLLLYSHRRCRGGVYSSVRLCTLHSSSDIVLRSQQRKDGSLSLDVVLATTHRRGNLLSDSHLRQILRPPTSMVSSLVNRLKNIYFDAKKVGSYGGVDALRRIARVSKKVVQRWLSEQVAYILHKPVRTRFKRRCVIVGGRNQQWQADLVDLSKLKRDNGGVTFLLTVIDIFSKKAWCVPLKNKSAFRWWRY